MTVVFNSGTQLKTYDSKNGSKKCSNPFCGKIHDINSFYCSCFGTDPFRNKNIADLSLSGFLPHLPYSWSRSITNLPMLLNVLEEINESEKLYANDSIQIKKYILQSFSAKGLVKIDSDKKDDIKYIKGGPERRVSEYLLTLQILHLIDDYYNLTGLGKFFVSTKNTMVLFLSFYILKIKDKYLRSKIYANFHVQHFKYLFNILKKEKVLSLEDLTFILMAHTDEDYDKVHTKFFNNTNNINLRKNLLETYFLDKDNKEMGRQKAAIFNILVSSNILNFDTKTKLYSLTEESKNCLEFIKLNENIVNNIVDDIYKQDDNKKHIDSLMLLFESTLKNNKSKVNELINKSGGKHENNMLKMFSKANINFRKYDKSFLHIKLPANVLSSLSGGTEHNPDHLCTVKNTSILVDSKSSSSIHGEIHKVIAYNGYAQEINSKAFIFLDGIFPNKTIPKLKKLLEETPQYIERVTLFTKSAINLLCKNNTVKQNFEDIYRSDKFLLVCTKEEKNLSKFEKELENNILILEDKK